MAKILTAAIVGIVSVGASEIERGDLGALSRLPDARGEHLSLIQLTGERRSFRNLLLSALGTEQLESGQLRIPVPVDGAVYEVIIAKPGEPKSVPIATK